jgi:hypothetical protein
MRNKDRKPKPVPEPPMEETPKTPKPKKKSAPPREWIPSGNGVGIVKFLAGNLGRSYTAIQIAAHLQTEKVGSVATLLSDFAKKGRVGKDAESGYTANEETVLALGRLG